MRFSTLLAAATVLATLAAPAAAHEFKAGALEIVHPWTRATPPGAKVGGGFLVIRNTGTEPDRLVGGAVSFADELQVHEMTMEGDVMKMRQLENGLEIPAGGEVTLKPGSFHIMFMGLKHGLEQGKDEKATLKFEKAGEVEVEFAVEGMGAKEPSHNGH